MYPSGYTCTFHLMSYVIKDNISDYIRTVVPEVRGGRYGVIMGGATEIPSDHAYFALGFTSSVSKS